MLLVSGYVGMSLFKSSSLQYQHCGADMPLALVYILYQACSGLIAACKSRRVSGHKACPGRMGTAQEMSINCPNERYKQIYAESPTHFHARLVSFKLLFWFVVGEKYLQFFFPCSWSLKPLVQDCKSFAQVSGNRFAISFPWLVSTSDQAFVKVYFDVSIRYRTLSQPLVVRPRQRHPHIWLPRVSAKKAKHSKLPKQSWR